MCPSVPAVLLAGALGTACGGGSGPPAQTAGAEGVPVVAVVSTSTDAHAQYYYRPPAPYIARYRPVYYNGYAHYYYGGRWTYYRPGYGWYAYDYYGDRTVSCN
jgi:hypothetical protein